MPEPEGPLSGLRALDLTDEKGAYCGKLLGDLGADVIRVEPPGGPPTRRLGPFYQDQPNPERSLSFWHYNTSKRGVTLNLEHPGGQELLCGLARRADLLIESFAPGYLATLGLDYEPLSALNQRLILVSITPFGQSEPWARYQGSDLVLQALGGLMQVCGEKDTPPLMAFGGQSWHIGSCFGAISAMAALNRRRATGRGQHIDVSIEACIAGVLEHVNVWYFYSSNRIAERQGSLHWTNNFRVFRCQDGYIATDIAARWDVLTAWLASESAAEDLLAEEWHDRRYRQEHVDRIIEVLQKWTATKTVDELAAEGQLRRLPYGRVATVDRFLANPQLNARGFFVSVPHPELGQEFIYPGAPYKLTQSPWRIGRRAPLPGEHNREVYCNDLGLSEQELARLQREGVV